ncbi:hypothetical protein AG1IA_05096 [Rhizoctonia solani AG-1 IA]|uniref:NIF system FeS cluster assembly NifU N-terminal domain-containing protein n=1 Tax=Thanatephorus cucumeris (strain AG1-IA) TaxID=983506 RepID=L8WVP5_THACA|nr:hypothetical protein AG1IA_05096 [Rhizoctonia solani AG-1 IA]
MFSVARTAIRQRTIAAPVVPAVKIWIGGMGVDVGAEQVGSMPKNDADVGTGLVGAPARMDRCGDVMKLQIRVDENGIISDVKFKTFGCGSAIASSSYMTERVKGLSLEEAGKIKNTEIAKELSLPPVKLHCSSESLGPLVGYGAYVFSWPVLAEDAIRSAIRDYRSKRSKMANPQKPGFIDVSQSAATGETVATAHPGQARATEVGDCPFSRFVYQETLVNTHTSRVQRSYIRPISSEVKTTKHQSPVNSKFRAWCTSLCDLSHPTTTTTTTASHIPLALPDKSDHLSKHKRSSSTFFFLVCIIATRTLPGGLTRPLHTPLDSSRLADVTLPAISAPPPPLAYGHTHTHTRWLTLNYRILEKGWTEMSLLWLARVMMRKIISSIGERGDWVVLMVCVSVPNYSPVLFRLNSRIGTPIPHRRPDGGLRIFSPAPVLPPIPYGALRGMDVFDRLDRHHIIQIFRGPTGGLPLFAHLPPFARTRAPEPDPEPYDVRMTHASVRPRLGFTFDFEQPEEEEQEEVGKSFVPLKPRARTPVKFKQTIEIPDSPPLRATADLEGKGKGKEVETEEFSAATAAAGDVRHKEIIEIYSDDDDEDKDGGEMVSVPSSSQHPPGPTTKITSLLICAGCRRPLRTGGDRLWALRCGHMIDSRCYSAFSRPLSARLDPPVGVPLLDGGYPHKRRKTGKGKGKPAVEVHEWKCPVKDCAKVHKSERTEDGEWVPTKDHGAIKFSLRHVHHAHPETGRILWNDVDPISHISGYETEYTHTIETRHLTVQKPASFERWSEWRTKRRRVPSTLYSPLHTPDWKSYETIGPATDKRETLLALAKMTNNAYFKDSALVGWYDLGGNWTNVRPCSHLFSKYRLRPVHIRIPGPRLSLLGQPNRRALDQGHVRDRIRRERDGRAG